MKLTYHGTAAAEAFPGMFCTCDTCERARKAGGRNIRGRSQALVNDDLLIDFPADTCMRVLAGRLDLPHIYNCIITHSHGDHFYPRDVEMRYPVYAHMKEEKPFTFYGTAPAKALWDAEVAKLGPNEARMRMQLVKPFETFTVGRYTVTPLEADHDPTTEPVFYLISDGEKNLLYANDTGVFPEATWAWLEEHRPKLDMLSLDCTAGLSAVWRRHHMSLDVNAEVRDRLREMGCVTDDTVCYVHHFSHNCLLTYDEMVPVAAQYGFAVSYDGCEVEF